jgi:hypothetical protein
MSGHKFCPGCDHPIARHYNDVRGVARCLVVERGTSTRGVIGLPYERSCECANGKLPKRKAVRTGTVYDDSIEITLEDAAKLRAAAQES